MNDGDRIDVKVGAQTGELKAGMDRSANIVQQATAKVQGEFDRMHARLSATVSKISAVFAGVGAVLAGGTWFKGIVDDTIKWDSQARSLSRSLGITTQEASALNEAVQDLGVETLNSNLSVDTLKRALAMMRRELATNEEAFNDLGIATRDSNGEYKNSLDIFLAAMGYLKGLEGETAKNIQGTRLFKRSWEEVRPLMGLTEDSLARTRKEMEKQGRVVSEEGIRKSIEYKRSLDQLDDKLQALSLTIGRNVVPGLTVMAGQVDWVTDRLVALTAAASNSLNVWAKWQRSAQAIQALGADFGLGKGPQPTPGSEGWGDVPPPEAGRKSGGKPTDPEKPPGGGGGSKGGGGGGLYQQWQEELELIRDEENRYLDFSKQEEREFWQAKLEICQEGSQEYTQVRRQLARLNKELAREEMQLQIADLRLQMESEKNSVQERLQLKQEEVKRIAAAYGEDSLKFKQAVQEKIRFEREAQKELDQLKISNIQKEKDFRLLDLEAAREDAAFKRQLGRLNATQELQALRQLKQQEWLIERQALEQERLIQAQKPREVDRINKQIELGERRHQLEMQKLNQQSSLALKARWDSFFQAFGSGFISALQGVWQGTQTLGEAVTNTLSNMLATLLNMVAQWALEWVANMLFAAIFGRTTAIERVTQEAGVAYAAAYASTCAIPIIGPALAPEVAAASMAGALAGGMPLASAAAGWDVPEDALSYVHKKEMILPPDLAERVRNFTAPAAPAKTVNIEKINFSPNLTFKHRLTTAEVDRFVRQDLMPAFEKELRRHL